MGLCGNLINVALIIFKYFFTFKYFKLFTYISLILLLLSCLKLFMFPLLILCLIQDGNLADHWNICPKVSSVKNKVRVVNYKREHTIT